MVGLGRSGRSVLEFLVALRDEGAQLEIAAVDESGGADLAEEAAKWAAAGVDVQVGVTDAAGEWDLIVASPGVPPSSSLILSAAAGGAPVVSEIELAWAHSDASFVAVTGTNGKTTTTMMVAHLLRTAGIQAEAVGNIDPPALAVAPRAPKGAVMVCEASSFQLANTFDFHPEVAILLNVTPDHLDWHGSMERYVSDKGRVFENLCGSDLAVIVVDDPGAATFVGKVEARGARVCRVSLGDLHPGGAAVVDGDLVLSTRDGDITLLPESELVVRGGHNVLNALAAAAAALEMGAAPDAIADGLRTFEPVEHRLEPVGVIGDVEYVNDSKATNQDATSAALTAFADRAVVLMLGGYRTRDASFAAVAALLPGRVREVIAFGAAAEDVVRDTSEVVPTRRATGLEDAVSQAAEAALPGDVVLLSPACKSFDEFRDYAERGRAFRALVARMTEERGGYER